MPPFLIDMAIILKMIKVLKRCAVDPLLCFLLILSKVFI